jgi:hypothetical protein
MHIVSTFLKGKFESSFSFDKFRLKFKEELLSKIIILLPRLNYNYSSCAWVEIIQQEFLYSRPTITNDYICQRMFKPKAAAAAAAEKK